MIFWLFSFTSFLRLFFRGPNIPEIVLRSAENSDLMYIFDLNKEVRFDTFYYGVCSYRSFSRHFQLEEKLVNKAVSDRIDLAVTVKGGFDAPVVLRLPKDYNPNEKHPLLVYVYGGPGIFLTFYILARSVKLLKRDTIFFNRQSNSTSKVVCRVGRLPHLQLRHCLRLHRRAWHRVPEQRVPLPAVPQPRHSRNGGSDQCHKTVAWKVSVFGLWKRCNLGMVLWRLCCRHDFDTGMNEEPSRPKRGCICQQPSEFTRRILFQKQSTNIWGFGLN